MEKDINYDKKFPLLPLRDVVVFPHIVIPLFVEMDKSIKALDAAMNGNRLIVLASQTDAQVASPQQSDIYEIGTVSEILQLLKLPDGTIKVLVEGISRGYIESYNDLNKDYFEVSIKNIERDVEVSSE